MLPRDAPGKRQLTFKRLGLTYSVLILFSGLWSLTGCSPKADPAPRLVENAKEHTAQSCQECHTEVYAAWAGTDHALANRPWNDDPHAAIWASFPADTSILPEMILGHLPLWQPLLPAAGGRWQAHEQAYDPLRKEWFGVFGDDTRRPGEWGHWSGRGMNWNSMCAHCHMTGYQKNYDPKTDTFNSTWVEQGISCIQCHGPTQPSHGKDSVVSGSPYHGDRQRIMHTCAHCHARNEQLTLNFQPGDFYHDHFRVTLPVEPGHYYPDGQQRDEVFNWTSVLLSRMGHAGVTCLDCHDPHTTQTILPISDNQLCLQCHAAPGREMPGGIRAVVIDPEVHSRHQPDSAGNQCVACHMPTTNYMLRAPRHDHGWLSPDPLLTRELGIPNACANCHADKGLDWMITETDKGFGTKVRSGQRARARAIAAVWRNEPGAAVGLIARYEAEDIPAWRATYLSLLPRTADAALGRPIATAALRAADPIERSAAVRYLANDPEAIALLTPLLQDPVRLVRIDAALALSSTLPEGSTARKELDAYFALTLDQPVGRMRLAHDLANRGQLEQALVEIDQAIAWDAQSPAFSESKGFILAGLGRMYQAGGSLRQAAELAPDGAAPLAMHAGLAYADAGDMRLAEDCFRLALRHDPGFHRAAYNLGLLLAQTGHVDAAIDSLKNAEVHAPKEPDYPYALSTLYLRNGDRVEAAAAARRVLRLVPAHVGARQVLQAAER